MKQTYILTEDKISLFCPEPWNNSWAIIASVSNGCGPAGWKIDVVPDSILGCYIGESCRIHDVQYEVGETIEDKDSGDRTFRNNMIRLIKGRTTNWFAKVFLLKARLRLAQKYYEFVVNFGGPAFWKDK